METLKAKKPMAFQLGLLTSTGRKGRLFSLSLALLEWHEIKPVQNNVNMLTISHGYERESLPNEWDWCVHIF